MAELENATLVWNLSTGRIYSYLFTGGDAVELDTLLDITKACKTKEQYQAKFSEVMKILDSAKADALKNSQGKVNFDLMLCVETDFDGNAKFVKDIISQREGKERVGVVLFPKFRHRLAEFERDELKMQFVKDSPASLFANTRDNAEIDFELTQNELNDVKEIDKLLQEKHNTKLSFNSLADICYVNRGYLDEDSFKRFERNHHSSVFGDKREENHLTVEQVENANEQIDNVVDKIVKAKLTPLEAMLYIGDFAMSFKYKYKKCGELDSSFVGALSSKKRYIICAGYTQLVNACVTKLNREWEKQGYNLGKLSSSHCGIRTYNRRLFGRNPVKLADIYGNEVTNYFEILRFEWKTAEVGHAINLIGIEDEKYGVKGEYINDSTSNDGKGINYSLFPLQDLAHYKNFVVGQNYVENDISVLGLRDKMLLLKEHKHCKPISADVFKDALQNMYKKTSNLDDVEIEKKVEKTIKRFNKYKKENFDKKVNADPVSAS